MRYLFCLRLKVPQLDALLKPDALLLGDVLRVHVALVEQLEERDDALRPTVLTVRHQLNPRLIKHLTYTMAGLEGEGVGVDPTVDLTLHTPPHCTHCPPSAEHPSHQTPGGQHDSGPSRRGRGWWALQ